MGVIQCKLCDFDEIKSSSSHREMKMINILTSQRVSACGPEICYNRDNNPQLVFPVI